MKKLTVLFIALVASATLVHAQVFNTSSTLKRGQFSVGVEPGLYINGASDFYLFLHGGVGITHNADFGLKLGVLGNTTYIGGDVEFNLAKIFSLSVGAHSWGDFGLDGTALLTFPLTSGVKIYTGLDSDIVFANDVQVPLWIPIGLQIGMNKNMAFLFESEINITDVGSHFLGGGLSFFF